MKNDIFELFDKNWDVIVLISAENPDNSLYFIVFYEGKANFCLQSCQKAPFYQKL